MPIKVYDRPKPDSGLIPAERHTEGRQILALDTLSKLAKQFSNRPDFGKLNELLVLTMSGQFSVPNVCALIRQPGTQSQVPLLYATGKFCNDKLLLSQELTPELTKHFLKNRLPVDVMQLTKDAGTASLGFVMSECGVKLVVPLLHNDNLIGLIGLGVRVTRKPFDESDIELLDTLVKTITPFLASSFLFLEIAGLNTWYLAILDSVGQGVFVFDSHYRLKKTNTTGFDILKSFKPHLVHMSSIQRAPIELVFPDDIFTGWIRRFKRSSGDTRNKILENLAAASGEVKRIYNVHVSQVSGRSVLESDLIITVDDITDQKENEHRLFELQKLADMGIMASSISHELNNFLGLILGGVEMTEMALKKDDLEKVNLNLSKLKKSVAKMERFTTGLMDYTKLEAQKQPGSLNSVILDVLSHVTAQRNFIPVRVLPELEASLPKMSIDSDQIAQLLLNILNNAADAINETGREAGEIVVKTYSSDNFVHLSISDNGVGIKPEVKDKLFKAHLTTKADGHGYGLVTCAKIIDNHSGDIKIETEIDKGTKFTLSFPLCGEGHSG